MAVILAATLEIGPRISAVQRLILHLRLETATIPNKKLWQVHTYHRLDSQNYNQYWEVN